MTIRIIATLVVALLNLVLVFVIYKKDKLKTKSITYFSTFCIFTFLWSISIAGTFIIQNIQLFIWLNKFSYFFAMGIFLLFFKFSIEYPYKTIKISRILKIILIAFSSLIFYYIFFNKLFSEIKLFSFGLHEIENNNILLIYGIYLIFLLLCSYYILIKKYILSQGINKTRLIIVIFGTLIPFILAMIFDWYVIYIGRYDLDRNGPFFAILMNASIAYLIFKKD